MRHHWLDPNDDDQQVPNLPTPAEIAAMAAEIKRINLENMRENDPHQKSIDMKICPRCRKFQIRQYFVGPRCANCHKKRKKHAVA